MRGESFRWLLRDVDWSVGPIDCWRRNDRHAERFAGEVPHLSKRHAHRRHCRTATVPGCDRRFDRRGVCISKRYLRTSWTRLSVEGWPKCRWPKTWRTASSLYSQSIECSVNRRDVEDESVFPRARSASVRLKGCSLRSVEVFQYLHNDRSPLASRSPDSVRVVHRWSVFGHVSSVVETVRDEWF